MSASRAFLRKEVLENIRNYKLFILFTVFALIGVTSPLSAKFLPELLSRLTDENITIIIEDPTYVDSWLQFFSNVNQIGLVVLLLVFSPIMSKEYEKGTLVHMVTKGLPRLSIYMGKLILLFSSWTLLYWLSALITLIYTNYYFPKSSLEGVLIATVSMYLFGLMLMALLLSVAVILRTSFGTLLTVGAFVGLLYLGELFPLIQKWSPLQLNSRNVEWLAGKEIGRELIQSFAVTGLLILLFIGIGAVFFKRKTIN